MQKKLVILVANIILFANMHHIFSMESGSVINFAKRSGMQTLQSMQPHLYLPEVVTGKHLFDAHISHHRVLNNQINSNEMLNQFKSEALEYSGKIDKNLERIKIIQEKVKQLKAIEIKIKNLRQVIYNPENNIEMPKVPKDETGTMIYDQIYDPDDMSCGFIADKFPSTSNPLMDAVFKKIALERQLKEEQQKLKEEIKINRQANNENIRPEKQWKQYLFNQKYKEKKEGWVNRFNKGVINKGYSYIYNGLSVLNGGVKAGEIRRKDIYRPKGVGKDADVIIMVVIHGTTSHEESGFYDDTNPIEKNYQYFKRCGEKRAEKENKILHLLSFQWNGALQEEEGRQLASEALAKILDKKIDKYPNAFIWCLGHSHGCTMISNMTHKLEEIRTNNGKLGKSINSLTYFACPIRPDEPFNQPINFDNLIYLHGPNDWTTRLGRIPEKVLYPTLKTVRVGAVQGASFVVGVTSQRLKSLDLAMNAKSAAILGGVIVTMAIGGTLVALPLASTLMNRPLNHSNIFPNQADKKMIGIQIGLDGKSLKHKEVTDVIQFLPEIEERLEKHYPGHIANNALFRFEGNSKKFENSPEESFVLWLDNINKRYGENIDEKGNLITSAQIIGNQDINNNNIVLFDLDSEKEFSRQQEEISKTLNKKA
ncbi:MAG: hypothetical protein WDZ41_03670 [Candidatus Babeliales bacterium]